MSKLQSKYVLSKARENQKLLRRYREAKQNNEIDAKLGKKLKLKPYKNRVNKLRKCLFQMAFPELRKEYKEYNEDINNEERNQKIAQKFDEAGEIEILNDKDK